MCRAKRVGREKGHFNFRTQRVSEGNATKIPQLLLQGSASPKPVQSVVGWGLGRTALPPLVINSTTRHEHPGLS